MALRFISQSGTRLGSVSHSVLRELADSLLAVAFPSSCLLCRRELKEANWSGVCPDCWESLGPWAGAACSRCGLPIASDQVTQSGSEESGAAASDVWCGQCRAGEYEFDLARSYGVYAGALRAAILQLKFHRRERLGRRLGEALSRTWSEIENNIELRGHEPPLLVPVPLHPSRQRERGFNQAELLAQGLARSLNRGRRGRASETRGTVWQRRVRIEASSLLRAQPTLPQAGLSLSRRQENVRGVFEVRHPERLRDRVVVLVDDVMTTGWTASACAGAIKRAGSQQVVVLTLARAMPQFPDIAPYPSHETFGEPVDDSGRQRQ